ncbi:DUF3180 domain-containing protein [Pseudonocardiaceae bacterium YIM PH 21723]|nr:DUF3180 domain-containing protein [Pseudonocardiaceae bacterium YIM PH 21723]
MKFTRFRDLVTTILVLAVLVYLLLTRNYGALPSPPRLAGTALLIIAVVNVVLAVNLRPRIQRKPEARPLDPLVAARAVRLAKASSVVGAVMAGLWLGLFGYVAPRSEELAAAESDTVTSVVGIACAAVLIGCALWLEHTCRTPRNDDQGGPRSSS